MSSLHSSMGKGRLILLLGALAALGPLSIDMYLPAFPAIERDLRTTPALVSGTVATFFIGLCLGQMIYGPLSDRVGRKKPLLLGIAVYLLGSLGCFASTEVHQLMAFRCLQALGACAGMVIGRAVIRDLFDPTESSKVFSLVMLTMGVAPILAPIAGQAVADVTGWRGIFGVMVSFALLVLVAVVRLLPADEPREAGLTPPLWRRSLAVLADPNFIAYGLAGTLIQGGLYAYISGASSLFMGDLHLTPKQFSLLFGVNAAGLIFAAQLNTVLLRRYSYRTVLGGSLRVAAVAAVVMAGMGLAHWHTLAVTVPLFVFIGSLGMVFPNSTAGALANQGHQAGTASAVLGVLQYGGAALAAATVAWLHHYSSAPLQLTIGACGVLSLLVFRTLVQRPIPSAA